jgi:hypothetical protein
MKGYEKNMIISVFAMVLIMVVILFWVMPFAQGVPWEKIWNIGPEGIPGPGTPGETPPSNTYGNLGSIEVPHVITDAGNPHQFSEVACDITNKIYEDFKAYGYEDRTGLFCYGPADYICFLSAGYFSLSDTPITDPAEVAAKEAILSANEQTKYCHVCNVSYFDEVCLNYDLKDRQVGPDDLCDGTVIVGSKASSEYFGNNVCNLKNPSWQDRCDNNPTPADYCDNTQDKIWWSSDSASFFNPAYPEWKVKDGVWLGYWDNKQLSTTPHKYLYGIFWRPQKNWDTQKYWWVVFYRVPAFNPGNSFNSWDVIKDTLKDNYRFNPLGFQYPEARTIADFIIESPDSKTISQLKEDIKSVTKIEDINNIHVEKCTNENDCLNVVGGTGGLSSVLPVTEQTGATSSGFGAFLDEHFNAEPFWIRTTIDPQDSDPAKNQFLAGKKWRVVIRNWFDRYDRVVGQFFNLLDWAYAYDHIDRTIAIYEYIPTQGTLSVSGTNGAKVSIGLGDVNWDGVVNDDDKNICNTAFGTVPGDPNWNVDCDMNLDNTIDILDITIIITNYGNRIIKTIPSSVNLDPGTYTLRAKYNNQIQHQTVDIVAGQTTTATFTWS